MKAAPMTTNIANTCPSRTCGSPTELMNDSFEAAQA
jgi:hypothetical protein